MKQKPLTSSEKRAKIVAQLSEECPKQIIDSICKLVERIENSSARIKEEGEVVRDQKGSVIEHPSIKIERDAIKLSSELISKWKRAHDSSSNEFKGF